jgi:hypothetical protein
MMNFPILRSRVLLAFFAATCAIALSCSFQPQAYAQSFLESAGLSPYTKYKTFETDHFIFIYQDGYLDFTQRAATHIEHAHEILSPILKWAPRQKTTILIADNADDANGFTLPALRVGIVLIATPPDASLSTAHTDDWIKLLVFHEYTHMLNIDATTGFMEGLRYIFGDIIRPNGLWPVWMLEGLAVYFETRTSETGRGRSPYYDSIVRAYFNEGKLETHNENGMTLDRVNGNFPYFPGGEIPYLFGYQLWNQFAKDPSLQNSDSLMGEYSIRSSHRIPYFIEQNLENITNKKWGDYWDSFLAETKTRVGKQIAAVKALGETPAQTITNARYSASGGMISPDGKTLAYTAITLDKIEGLYFIDLASGKETYVDEKIEGNGLGFSPDSRFLFYSQLGRIDTYSFFSDLYAYDLQKQRVIRLSQSLRAKDPHVSPDGKYITFIQTAKATNYLRIAPLEKDKNGEPKLGALKTIYKPSQFAILGTPRFISNQEVAFSLQEIGKKQSDLMAVNLDGSKSRVLVADGAMNRYPFANQNSVYYTSDKTGIENVYDLQSHQQITNVITGTILPFTAPNGTLYGSLMTSNGYELAKFSPKALPTNSSATKIAIPNAPKPIPEALVSPAIPLNPQNIKNYSPWSSMAPREWSPLGYVNYNGNSGTTVGGLVLGFDATGNQQYLGLGAYNFKVKTVDGLFSYTLYTFRPEITFSASAQTFNIATDPQQELYYRTYETSVNFQYPFVYTYSSLRPAIYGFMDWSSVNNIYTGQRVQTGEFEYDNPRVPGVGATLTYSSAEQSILAISPEQGIDATIGAEGRFNNPLSGPSYTRVKYLALFDTYLRVGEHSVFKPTLKWLGTNHPEGYVGAPNDSYALLEGKNPANIFDRGTSLSFETMEFRGYASEVFGTRDTGVASLDYYFPISKLFLGAGTFPAFIDQLSGFLYGETAYIPSVHYGNLFLPSFGGGLSLDTTLLIRAPVRFNLEVQNGTKKDFGGDTLYFLSIQSSSLF